MAIWLFRAGSSGEYEQKFLDDGKVYLTWYGLAIDLSRIGSKKDLYKTLRSHYLESNAARVRNWGSQIWPVCHEMVPGDWVVLPSKKKGSIHIGEITGDYVYIKNAVDPYHHYRTVNWFAQDIPRSNFDQDILYTFGAFMTVCRVSRNDAEQRIIAMSKNKWKTPSKLPTLNLESDDSDVEPSIDLETVGLDQIAKHISRKFTGHGLTRLVDAILRAKGFTTFVSPEGPDKGVDILAAPDELGFGSPRICVQVKSGDTAVDRPTLDQLIGAMRNVNAEQGLLVSWSGFRSTVDKEIPGQFFVVRMWDQKTIIDELLSVYDKLDEDIKAEIPLKRFWCLTEGAN